MAEKEHFTSVKKLGKWHLSDPNNTGCLWRQDASARHKQPIEGPCDYLYNSFDISKSRPQYKKATGGWKVTEGKSEDVIQEAYLAVGLGKGKTKRKANSWSKKFAAAYGDSLYRLKKDPKGWDVGATPTKTDANYFGSRGGGGDTTNHKPAGSGGLGAWYPYDHEHHHLITDGSMKSTLSDMNGKMRVQAAMVFLTSGWNLNNKGNMVLLPTDVTVAKIIRLPPHCPWGALNHPKWGRDVKTKLEKIIKKVKDAIAEADPDDEPHERYKDASVEIANDLVALSNELRVTCMTSTSL